MGQAAPGRAEVGKGRGMQQIGYPTRVDIGIALDLPGEVALVVAGAGKQAPAGIGQFATGLGEGADFRVERQELAPEV